MTRQYRGESRASTRMSATWATITALTLGLLLAPACTAAAPTPPAAPEPVSAQPRSEVDPALWVVRDADSILYLFGTVHFLRPETVWDSDRVKDAFESADTLVLEVADPNDQTAVLPLVQQYGMSPDRPLSGLLTDTELARLDEAARVLGAQAAQLDAMRPWLAGVMLSSSVLLKAGYEPGSGADMVLRERAQVAGMPILGLETAQDQVRMLSSFPEEGQLVFLRRTLADFDNAGVVPDRLVEAWTAGDVDAIDALAVTPIRDDSELVYQRLLAERNTRWADQIEAMLERPGTTFIAVGVLHLVGEDSVQAILRSRGIEVTEAP